MRKLLIITLVTTFALGPLSSLAQTSVTNNFFVEPSFDFAGRQKVSSTLRYESASAYFYIEDTVYSGLSSSKKSSMDAALLALANEFDSNIYPKLRNVYGSELSPGIDNDTKITILFTRTSPGVKGYFLAQNQVSRSVNSASNEREMLYLNADTLLEGTAKIHLAHEFTHLIEYNQRNVLRSPQKRWLSEALAEYAPTLLGYNASYEGSYLETRANDFLSFSSDSLISWRGNSVDMATSSMFMHYLAGQYGTGLITEIMRAPAVGDSAVTQALSARGISEDFKSVFTNWTVANYVNSSGKYAYKVPGLSFSNLHISTPLQYSIFSNSAITTNFFVDYSSAAWLKFVPGQLGANGKNVLRVEFDSSQSSGKFGVPYVITDIFGRSEVRFMELVNDKGIVYVENFGTSVISVVVAPSNYYQTNLLQPPAGSFTIKVNMAEYAGDTGTVNGDTDYADGALLRAQGDPKVYVIKKLDNGELFKRWIPTAEIFEQYGHLRWEDIIDVPAIELDKYTQSTLIKFIGDYKVYELNSTHTQKQWLNITPAVFDTSGRNWNAIYEVNEKEYNHYTTGTAKTS